MRITMDCDQTRPAMPMINDDAPAFQANTTQGEIDFPADYSGKWVVLFSHPADFTPVCTTEFMTLASMTDEFKAINTELIGLSVDSLYSHIAWLRRIQGMSWKGIKKPEVTFPVIEDVGMDVARLYGMIQPNASETQAVRAVFIIDPEGKIRATICYPQSLGRNFAEIKRIVVALQTADEQECATPANWKPGDDVVMPVPGSCGTAKDRVESKTEGVKCLDWFLCFKPDANAKPHAKRGRKPKAKVAEAPVADAVPEAPAPKKRGRKPKAAATAEPAKDEAAPAPKKRGRKPKNPVQE